MERVHDIRPHYLEGDERELGRRPDVAHTRSHVLVQLAPAGHIEQDLVAACWPYQNTPHQRHVGGRENIRRNTLSVHSSGLRAMALLSHDLLHILAPIKILVRNC